LHLQVLDAGLRVNILINNAGIGNTQLFAETPPELFKQQIKLNVLATTLLTSLFIPELKKNGPSNILNVGSLSSFFYLPKKQVYGATKSFIYFFSKSLRRELQHDDISVSVVCPGGMNTNFHVSLLNRSAGFISRMSILNPEDVAPVVIGKMIKGKEVIIPGTVNRLSMLLDKLLPVFMKKMITERLMKDLKPVTQPKPISKNSPLAA
jgi:short-subunit dehydrogenase